MGEDSGTRLGGKTVYEVLLDTSALLLLEESVDIFEEIEDFLEAPCRFLIPEAVLKELRKLSRLKGKKGRGARLALEYLKLRKEKIEVVGQGREYPVDEAVIELARERNPVVVTLDRELRRRLKDTGIRVLTWWSGKAKFSSG